MNRDFRHHGEFSPSLPPKVRFWRAVGHAPLRGSIKTAPEHLRDETPIVCVRPPDTTVYAVLPRI